MPYELPCAKEERVEWCVYIENTYRYTILLEPKEMGIILVAKERFTLALVDFS